MIDTHKINIFLSAVEETSFSAAAKKLKMSQPAVSLQIQALEQQLGVELFRRTGRNVVLTEAGHALVPLARQMLGLSNHIEETMCSLRGKLVGQLAIGCAATPTQYILPRLAIMFKQQNPDVSIQIQIMDPQDVVDRLLEQEIHMGVLAYEPRHRVIKTRPFMEDETVLLVPRGHRWADRSEVSLKELANGDTTLLVEQERRHSDPLWRRLEKIAPPEVMESAIALGCPEAILAAIESSLGIAIVSRLVARKSAEGGWGTMLRFKEGPFTRTLYFCSNADHPEVCARVGFCDYVHSDEVVELIRQWTA